MSTLSILSPWSHATTECLENSDTVQSWFGAKALRSCLTRLLVGPTLHRNTAPGKPRYQHRSEATNPIAPLPKVHRLIPPKLWSSQEHPLQWLRKWGHWPTIHRYRAILSRCGNNRSLHRKALTNQPTPYCSSRPLARSNQSRWTPEFLFHSFLATIPMNQSFGK